MKKSQSQIITIVLLILLVIAAIIIVWQVVIKTIEKPKKEISEKLDCLTKVDLEVVESCYKNKMIGGTIIPNVWDIKITLKNRGKIDYTTEDFIFYITNNGNTKKIPILSSGSLKALEQKIFLIDYSNHPQNAEEFLLVPRIKTEKEFIDCYEQAVEFDKPTECSS